MKSNYFMSLGVTLLDHGAKTLGTTGLIFVHLLYFMRLLVFLGKILQGILVVR